VHGRTAGGGPFGAQPDHVGHFSLLRVFANSVPEEL
jgi:hypothetical protein